MNHKSISILYLFIVLFVISLLVTCDQKRYLSDPQGNRYKIVKIGDQEWMAKNLDYNVGEGFYWYDNDSTCNSEMGGLYTWGAALTASEKIQGWHLPSKQEWQKLIKFYGGQGGEEDSLAYFNLMSGKTDFNPQWSGVRISDGIFKAKQMKGVNYWSSTPCDTNATLAYSVAVLSKFKIVSPHHYPKVNACSVRLVKDK